MKKIILAVLLLMLVGCAPGEATIAEDNIQGDIRIVKLSGCGCDKKGEAKLLGDIANQGWELVGTSGDYRYFKKRGL